MMMDCRSWAGDGMFLRRCFLLVTFIVAAWVFPVAAKPTCFTPSEAEAAHLRVLQQQFTVAALSCQTLDPADPSFAARYNRFIELFAPQLQNNSETLYHHFGRGNTELDRWITRIANDAGQRVLNSPNFCQEAWNRLDVMITLAPSEMESFAVKSEAASDFAPLCPIKPAADKKKASAK